MSADYRSTDKNFHNHAMKPVARWLIEASRGRSVITYGAAANRLMREHNFANPLPRQMGRVVELLRKHLACMDSNPPLLSILMVREHGGLPGSGAGKGMAERFQCPQLHDGKAFKNNRKLWVTYFENARDEVYRYSSWERAYDQIHSD